MLNGLACDAVFLENRQFRSLAISENDSLLIPRAESDGLGPIRILVRQIVGGGDGFLRHLIHAGIYPQGDRTVRAGGPVVLVGPIQGLDRQDCLRDRGLAVRVNFLEGEQGLFEVVKNQLLVLAGAKIDGLGGFVSNDPGGRDALFRDFVRIYRDIGENSLPVRSGSHIVVVSVVDTFNLEMGTGNGLLGLRIPFEERQRGQFFIRRSDGNRSAPVDSGLIHMGNHRLGELGPGRWDRDLHKGVHALGHVRHCDGAVRLGCLCAHNLAVPEDVEHRAGEGIIGIIQLDEPDFYLAVVFKNQGDVGPAIPYKRLLDLALVGTLGVSLRWGHLLCGKAANGHLVPGYICQISTAPGGIGAHEVIIHTGDFNDRSREALGGIVCVHLPDGPLAGGGRGVREGNGHGIAGAVGQDHILRAGIVNLVPARRGRSLRHGVGVGGEALQTAGPIRPGGHILCVSAIFGLHMELRPLQALGGIRGVHFFDNQGIPFRGGLYGQIPDHDLLNAACGMCGASGSGKGILVDLTVAPHALISKIKDKLCPVPEGDAIAFLINAGEMGALQRVIDCHQFLRAAHHWIAEAALLVTPDNGLHPCVHVPGVGRIPNGVYAQCLGPVCKYAGRMGVIIGHHHGDRGIRNGGLIPPSLANERLAHAAAFRAAKANPGCAAVVVVHLMQAGRAQLRGGVGDAGHPEALQLDRVRSRRQCGDGEQPENTDGRQQQGGHSGPQMSKLIHMRSFLF